MKERPILFSGPMVRAILDGRKTQTRRAIKLPLKCKAHGVSINSISQRDQSEILQYCPYGQPGDRLWVKETFAYAGSEINLVPGFVYRATDPDWSTLVGFRWKPSIFCTRDASRITLEITAIGIERLQAITTRDALAEGVAYDVSKPDGAPAAVFRTLWQSINGPDSWAANPWVWVIYFKALPPRLRASA